MDSGYNQNSQEEDELDGGHVLYEYLRDKELPVAVSYAEHKVDHADGYLNRKVTGTGIPAFSEEKEEAFLLGY